MADDEGSGWGSRPSTALEERQKTYFLQFFNHHLAERNIQVDQIDSSLGDGIAMLNLLEILSRKHAPRFHNHPKTLNERINNVSVALTFLQDLGVRIYGCNAQAIAEGNMKQIMGLIFLLTQRFKIDAEAEESRLKEKLTSSRQPVHSVALPGSPLTSHHLARSVTSPVNSSSSSTPTSGSPSVSSLPPSSPPLTSSPAASAPPPQRSARAPMQLQMEQEESVIECRDIPVSVAAPASAPSPPLPATPPIASSTSSTDARAHLPVVPLVDSSNRPKLIHAETPHIIRVPLQDTPEEPDALFSSQRSVSRQSTTESIQERSFEAETSPKAIVLKKGTDILREHGSQPRLPDYSAKASPLKDPIMRSEGYDAMPVNLEPDYVEMPISPPKDPQQDGHHSPLPPPRVVVDAPDSASESPYHSPLPPRSSSSPKRSSPRSRDGSTGASGSHARRDGSSPAKRDGSSPARKDSNSADPEGRRKHVRVKKDVTMVTIERPLRPPDSSSESSRSDKKALGDGSKSKSPAPAPAPAAAATAATVTAAAAPEDVQRALKSQLMDEIKKPETKAASTKDPRQRELKAKLLTEITTTNANDMTPVNRAKGEQGSGAGFFNIIRTTLRGRKGSDAGSTASLPPSANASPLLQPIGRDRGASTAEGSLGPERGSRPQSAYVTKSYTMHQVVIIQSLIRRYLARQQLKRLKAQKLRQEKLVAEINADPSKMKKVIKLQAFFRGRLARRRFRRMNKRTEICREILATERTYVSSLEILVRKYLAPMRQHPDFSVPELIRTTVGGLEVILSYNSQLLARLEARMEKFYSEGQRMGDIFLGVVNFLRVYTGYVNQYNALTTTVSEMKRTEPKFCAFLETVRWQPDVAGRDLNSFLIMPIQRLPRYVMLLEDLLKHTKPDHADYVSLGQARDKMKEVADYVNDKKKEAENHTMLIAIQEKLTGKFEKNFLSREAHRRYVRRGALSLMPDFNTVDNSRSLRKEETYCFLFNDMLVITYPNDPNWKAALKPSLVTDVIPESQTFRFKQVVPLEGARLRDFDDESPSFEVVTERKAPFVFIASNKAEKEVWISDIDENINRLMERRRSRLAPSLLTNDQPHEPDLSSVSVKQHERSGTLEKQGHEPWTWKSVWTLVRSPYLFYFKTVPTAGVAAAAASGCIYLLSASVKLATIAERPNSFVVSTPTRNYHFSCAKRSELCDWMYSIRKVIHDHLDHIQKEEERRASSSNDDNSLHSLLKNPLNQTCADCNAKDPKWADITYGVWICTDCSGIHRRLTPSPLVKSAAFGKWDPAYIEVMKSTDNDRANQEYERNVPGYMQRPNEKTPYAQKIKYIQAKYSGAPSKLAAEKGSLTTMVVGTLSSLPTLTATIAQKAKRISTAMPGEKEPKSEKDKSERSEKDSKSERSEARASAKERGSPDLASKKKQDPEEMSIDSSQSQASIVIRKTNSEDRSTKKQREHKSKKGSEREKEREKEKKEKSRSAKEVVVRKSRKSSRREGYILVQRSSRPSQWRRKWFILYSDRLSYYKAKEREQRQGTIALFSSTIEKKAGEIGGHANLLAIASPDRLFMLSCETPEEQQQWFDEISRNINWIAKNPPMTLAIGRTIRQASRADRDIEDAAKQALQDIQTKDTATATTTTNAATPVPTSTSNSSATSNTNAPPLSPPAKSAMKSKTGDKSRKRATISDAPVEEIKK